MSRLDELKARAKELGVTHHHMAGEAKIEAAINAHLAANAEAEEVEPAPEFKFPVNKRQVNEEGQIVPITSIEHRKSDLPDRIRKLGRLVRCRITCMNPAKREWEGEIISVGSAKHGTFKKYVPFDGREFHIPQIIFDALKERKCTIYHTVRDARGQKVRKGRLIDEFAIEVLPQLSKAELAELKKAQALADGQANAA